MPNLSSFNIELSKNHAFLHNDRSLIPDYIYSDFSDKNECDFSADFAYVKNFIQLEKNLPNTYKVEYFNCNYSSGFAGALLRDKNSGNYIIAFRGTDKLVDSLS
jgi:hypothetical protein